MRWIVRAQVVTSLASALTLAEQELTSGEWDVHVRAASVAEAVERALYGVFGGVGKEYRSKFRSLHFNIKVRTRRRTLCQATSVVTQEFGVTHKRIAKLLCVTCGVTRELSCC